MKPTEAISAPRRLLRTAMPSTPPPPPNLRSSLALLRLSPLLLAAALAVAAVGISLPDAVEASEPTVLPTIKCDSTDVCVPYVGETLHADVTGIPDAYGLTEVDVEYSYQWVAADGSADADIVGATARTYTLTSAEAGKTIKVRVSFTNNGGKDVTLTSPATEPVGTSKKPDVVLENPYVAPSNQLNPGDSYIFGVTARNHGGAESIVTQSIRYYYSLDATVSSNDIQKEGRRWVRPLAPSATSQHAITFRAPSGGGTFFYYACLGSSLNNCSPSIQVEVLKPNSAPTGLPTVTGTAQVSQALTAGTSGIADADGLTNVTYSYQWLADDTEIDGATSSTYTIQSADQGKVIKVRVIFTDDAGNDELLTSTGTATVAVGGL